MLTLTLMWSPNKHIASWDSEEIVPRKKKSNDIVKPSTIWSKECSSKVKKDFQEYVMMPGK